MISDTMEVVNCQLITELTTYLEAEMGFVENCLMNNMGQRKYMHFLLT